MKAPLLSLSLAALCLLLGTLGMALGSDGFSWPEGILLSYRLCRVLAGFLGGAALAFSGSLFQNLFRNPLADAYLLGVSQGAALGAAACLLWGGALLAPWLPLGAFLGGFSALLLTLALAGGRNDSPEPLLLNGIVAGALLSGLLLCLLSRATSDQLAGVTWWMLGDLQAVPPVALSILGVALGLALLLAAYWSREINALALGDDWALSLGVRPLPIRLALLGCGALLVALCVSSMGIISFVGLLVPQTLRRMLGGDFHRLLLPTALGGGAFLQLCDLLAKGLDPVRPLPVGVLTALAGGIFLLVALHGRRCP